MLYAVGSSLPEFRVRAHNNAIDRSNPIYEDECARRFGYRGGLVSGASIYAYMSRALVEFAGKDWLHHGSADVRFVHPVYEGEELIVSGSLTSVAQDGSPRMECRVCNAQGMECSGGVAALPSGAPGPTPKLRDYPAGRRKNRKPISLDVLKPGERLEPITSAFTSASQWEYCRKAVRDHHPLYRKIPHPGWLLSQANLIFAANYELHPWILVSSFVEKHHCQERECLVETRGSVQDRFEHKGHHFVVLDLALFAGRRCLETIRHTIIFRIAPQAA